MAEPRDRGGRGALVPEVLPPASAALPFGEEPVAAAPRPLPHRPRWGLAALLAVTHLFTTTVLGAFYVIATHPVQLAPFAWPLLGPRMVSWVWTNPQVLRQGLAFSSAAFVILLAHELGHYLACRRYRLPSTVPYFLPLPLGFGTLGAFIRITAPIRDRRQLFDVGIAGPLAGFVALLPFLLVGIARSEVVVPPAFVEPSEAAARIFLPGRCLAITVASSLFHGPLPEGSILHLHPLAFAAWFGLLVTSINLLPAGQLDGGHVLYSVSPCWQHRLAFPVWLAIALLTFHFIGWIVWSLLLLLIGLRHPPVSHPRPGLGPGRLALAALALVILVLSFMPMPFTEMPID